MNKEKAKETAKKAAKGLLSFSSKAVFYIPRSADHVAMKMLKCGALAHSAYTSIKDYILDDEEENDQQTGKENEDAQETEEVSERPKEG